MAMKRFKCPKCDRSFGMAAHLARHTTTIHGMAGKKKATKKKTGKGRVGRPKGSGMVRSVAGVRLADLSLDELGRLISAARLQARSKIAEFEHAIG